MKEELLRVLNVKLDDVMINIESLNELNKKIEKAEEDLSYIKGKIDLFTENDKYNVLNFTKLSHDEFDNVLSIVGSDIGNVFKTNNCNYEGLVYLINGINNGVSLSLTLEQENAINYLINGMEGVMHNDMAIVDGLYLAKTRFAIDDVNVLNEKKNEFERIISSANNDEYLDEIDEIQEAMTFSGLDSSQMNDILVYLLNYNAEIYNKEKETKKYEVKEEVQDVEENVGDDLEISSESDIVKEPQEKVEEQVVFNDSKDDVEFHLPEFNKIEEKNEKEEISIPTNYEIPVMPLEENVADNIDVSIPDLPLDQEVAKESQEEVQNNDIDTDFKDIVPQEDYEEYKPLDETISITPVNPKASTREVQRLFQEFGVNISDDELNNYTEGDAEEYKKIITVLKDNDVLDDLVKDKDLFREIIVNSRESDIVNVLNIIKNDLSVDSEDYGTTLKIVINTIPSVFVNNGGNYDNFVNNVQLFKELGINLVNLFDFSKEVLIANHDNILNNYELVKNYNINIDYKNAKYYLLLDDIASRMDYYVESLYKDENKDEMFDGIQFIKEYPGKLNMVTSETIKRLRYSSENNRKVFGSKPNSLTGEITNLKVNVLDIPEDYMNAFFDNHFDGISSDEVRQYAKLCNNSVNVGNFVNELSDLEKYHDNLRYNINGINISYNKVVRLYNTLRSYGIDINKSKEFAVCYNLVITKDEYHSLKKVLTEGVGE